MVLLRAQVRAGTGALSPGFSERTQGLPSGDYTVQAVSNRQETFDL